MPNNSLDNARKEVHQILTQRRTQLVNILLQQPQTFTKEQLQDKVTIIAHRGVGPTNRNFPGSELPSGMIPENSIAAFQDAILRGANGIELDVVMSKDGEIMVLHDSAIAINAGAYHNYIAEQDITDPFLLTNGHTKDELKELFPLAHGHEIPTLLEVIDLVNNVPKDLIKENFLVNIELQAKKHWAESEKRALVDATFQVIVQAIQKSSGRLSFANFAITAFDEDSIKFMREAYDRYAVDNSMQPPLKLMQGIYTDKIANSKLGSNWVPVCRQPDGNLYLSESGLYVIDTSLNQTYISDAFEKFKKNGACAVDMPTCDVKEEMAVACCAQELMITAALQDTRAKFEFLLEIIGALSSLMPEVPKEKLNDILFMNQLKKCFPYVTNDQYSQEQLKLVLAISEDLVSREDLEHVEMIRMMGVAIKNKVSVIYKADDIESATNALEAIYKGYVHELLKDKSGLFFSGSHHVVSNVSEESSKVQNPTPPRPV